MEGKKQAEEQALTVALGPKEKGEYLRELRQMLAGISEQITALQDDQGSERKRRRLEDTENENSDNENSDEEQENNDSESSDDFDSEDSDDSDSGDDSDDSESDDNIEEDSDMVELKEHKPATQLTLQKQQSSDDIYSDDFK